MNKVIFKFLVVVASYFTITANVMAFGIGGGDAIGESLCGLVDMLSGGIGAAIASFAVIFLGIGAFFGKVTWGTALLTATAIIAIFGYADILDALSMGGIGIYSC